MKNYTLCFLLLISFGLKAQKSPDFFDEIYYIISNESKDSTLGYHGPRKNSLSLQLGGDTPYVGTKYSRRIYLSENCKKSMEAGLGIGLAPHFFYSGAEKPSNLSFSHHTTFLFRSHKILKPYVSYSGVFYSYSFYRNKKFNYLPSPSIGFRIGEFEKLSLNIFWQAYFYRQLDYRLRDNDILQTFDRKKVFSVPGISLTIPFK